MRTRRKWETSGACVFSVELFDPFLLSASSACGSHCLEEGCPSSPTGPWACSVNSLLSPPLRVMSSVTAELPWNRHSGMLIWDDDPRAKWDTTEQSL